MSLGTLERPILCCVTDGRLHSHGDVAAAVKTVARVARAGVDLIQIRERDVEDRTLLTFVRDARRAIEGTSARIVVNDRLDVALAAAAAGVHLRGDSMDAADVRRIVPAGFLVGRSVHDESEAVAAAARGGTNYLIFGTVFPSASKPEGHAAAGLDALRRVAASVSLPVLAIGGISVDRAGDVAAAGAAGIAAIGLFVRSISLEDDVARLRRAFDT